MMHLRTTLLLTLIMLGVGLAACGPSQAELDSTATAIVLEIYATQTAEAPQVTDTATPLPPTETPLPTDTPTPEPTATPEPTSTPTPDLTATAAFQATALMEVFISVIGDDLELAGFSADQGSLAWVQEDPETIKLKNYWSNNFVPLDDGKVYSDFILRSDVTWDSTSGLATCGFWFRGESTDEDDEHYIFEALRLSGAPAWWVTFWRNGVEESVLTGNARFSRAIRLEDMSTNEYLFVAEENVLSIYVNGESLGQVTINRLSEGVSAFFAFQESGETECTFSNSWIWDLTE